MPPAGLFFTPLTQFMGADGITPLDGGLLSFFAAGTDTPLPVFSDSDLTVEYTQPIELTALGILPGPVFLSPLAYKVLLTDADAVPIAGWPVDDVSSPGLPEPAPTPSGDSNLVPIFATMADVVTDAALETSLSLESIPGGTLANDGESLEVIYAGQSAGGATPSWVVSFGGTEIVGPLAPAAVIAQGWRLMVTIVRVNTTTVRCLLSVLVACATPSALSTFYQEITSLDLTADLPLQLTGQVTDAGDSLTLKFAKGVWIAAPA